MEGVPAITSGFGPRWGKNHNGLDIGRDIGTKVYGAASGTVVWADWPQPDPKKKGDQEIFEAGRLGYGLYIIIEHNEGEYYTRYAHLDSLAEGLTGGTEVHAGQLVDYSVN